MMVTRILLHAVALLVTIAVTAQHPVFVPDDFVEPALRSKPLFLSRFAAGYAWNPSNHYRPYPDDAGFVLITNSLYLRQFQFDYKHQELLGEDDVPLQRCDCPEPVYFPTPPPATATPDAPAPGRSDTLQMSVYRTFARSSDRPITLRFRLSYTGQAIDTVVTSGANGAILERRSGRDQSFTFDADTYFRIAGHDVWGTVYGARTTRSGTPDNRVQNELGYVSRLPGWTAGPVLFRPRLTLAGITGRGASGLTVINPSLEAYWRHAGTKANFHLVWSGERIRDGAEGWQTNHQIAIFLDRTLYLKAFGSAEE